MAAAGMVFLLGYGLQAWRRAWQGESMAVAAGPGLSRRAAVLQLAGFTLLNPHVYLDTVLLMGGMGAQWPGTAERAAFVAGAALASTLWFHGLAYGARAMAGWFARPAAWRVLDTVIGTMMLALCAGLLPLALGR
jgi:L-lysine exporter family protein LysE/ArgO